jgi:glycosyltransferase involved in cell wall biosynthesis
MRILLLNWRDVRHPKSGGAELVTMEHAKGWVKAGHRVTWLTASYSGAKHESTVEGVGFVRRWGSLTIYLYAPLYLLTHARSFDVIVDEVHGFPFFSPLFTRKPVVVFIHEIAGEIWNFMFPFPKNMIGKFLERLYFRLYRHCLFWTDAPSTVDELVSRGIPRSQCTAIPCPIVKPPGTGNHEPGTRNKEQNPTYIFLSRVVRMKGVEEIIKAFSFIVRTETSAKLWIVGSGEPAYIEELKRMMQEYGIEDHVTLYGNVSEKRKFELLSRAHLLLHASVKEGWGLVVLEAAAVGTPAVVYNVAGLKDVVKDNETGVVIADNSPADMAREAIKLRHNTDLYRLFQKNAKQWAASLQWSDACKQSLRLLEKAVQKR